MPLPEIKKTQLYANFEKGDLLYGLQVTREPYLAALRGKAGDSYITVDSLNNTILIPSLKLSGKFDEGSHNRVMEKVDEISKEYSAYLFGQKKYTPRYLDNKGNAESVKIKRSCKAAITWNRKIQADRTLIHFCLDGLDEKRIFSKLDESANIPKIDQSFTSSELRYIYKHWPDLKKANKVIFYHDGEVVSAPWEINTQRWTEGYRKRESYGPEFFGGAKASVQSINLRKRGARNEEDEFDAYVKKEINELDHMAKILSSATNAIVSINPLVSETNIPKTVSIRRKLL